MRGDLLPETRDRILEGALTALGRHGYRRLTMTDVSESAGLSRGTVYRYFPSKEDLLAVLSEYERDRFADGLRSALRGVTGDRPRLEAVAEYIMSYLRQHPALTLLIETEPAFVIGFMRQQLRVFHSLMEELISPVMENAGPVKEGRVTASELSELLLRVVLSVFLVPGESDAAVAGALDSALDSIVRLAGVRSPAEQGASYSSRQ